MLKKRGKYTENIPILKPKSGFFSTFIYIEKKPAFENLIKN